MKKAILATKVGMTQIFNDEGVLVPVTVLQAGPCVVTQVKTEENDGYKAVQVGFVDKREKLVNKPVKGHFDKAGVSYKRFVSVTGVQTCALPIFDESLMSSLLELLSGIFVLMNCSQNGYYLFLSWQRHRSTHL